MFPLLREGGGTALSFKTRFYLHIAFNGIITTGGSAAGREHLDDGARVLRKRP